jgi:hypothetical protein
METSCPVCGKRFRGKPETAGRRFNCVCGERLQMPLDCPESPAIVPVNATSDPNPNLDGRWYCLDCEERMDGEPYSPGFFAIELALWCLMFIPGVIYTFWRICNRKYRCNFCHSERLIPSNSKKAGGNGRGPVPDPRPPVSLATKIILWTLLTPFVLALAIRIVGAAFHH